MSNTETVRRNWREALAAYRDRRVVTMFFLGISAGLPVLSQFQERTFGRA